MPLKFPFIKIKIFERKGKTTNEPFWRNHWWKYYLKPTHRSYSQINLCFITNIWQKTIFEVENISWIPHSNFYRKIILQKT